MKTLQTILFVALALCLPLGVAAQQQEKPPESVDDLQRKARLALFEASQFRDDGDYVAAARVVREYLEQHPDNDHYLLRFSLANDLTKTDKDEEALPEYQRCVALEPRFAQGWLNLGELAYNLEQYALAADALEKGFELHPEKPANILYYGAVAWILDAQPSKAIPTLERLVSGEHGPPSLEWYRALVSSCIEVKDKERGDAAVDGMLAVLANDPDAWYLAFQYYAGMADYRQAAVALTVTGYMRPLTRQERVQLGDLYSVINVPAAASENYALVVGDSLTTLGEIERLASAYIAAHDMPAAAETLETAIEANPTFRLWSMLGDLYFMERKYEASANAFAQCAAIDPNQPRPYLMMAYCAIELERYQDAIAHLETAASFPEEEERALNLIQRLTKLQG